MLFYAQQYGRGQMLQWEKPQARVGRSGLLAPLIRLLP